MPLIPGLWRLRQEEYELEAIMGYIARHVSVEKKKHMYLASIECKCWL